MKLKILLLIIVLLSISCTNQKTTDNKLKNSIIEIYVPKNRIKSKMGIDLPKEIKTTRRPFSEFDSIGIEQTRYDTINKRRIFTGEFESNELDLREFPLIKDSEIIGFDFNTNELILTQSGAKKIYEQPSDWWWSIQFIITANRTPILNGYFFNSLSSSYVDAYQIEYTNYNDNVKNRKGEHRFIIRNKAIIDGLEKYNQLPDLRSNKLFFYAFENRPKRNLE